MGGGWVGESVTLGGNEGEKDDKGRNGEKWKMGGGRWNGCVKEVLWGEGEMEGGFS